MIKFVDMFSGIGGFREGLTRAGGFECVGHCEIDKYANRSYNALFDTKGEWFIEDARKADPSTMPDFQLLCGGFPCQTFSIAGSRKGFGDPRGTLFFELARLAEARKPPYLLFENVPGLLSHDGGRTFATILNTLDRLGYGVEWQCLNSKDFGVPQSRNRVYIVGYLDERCRGKVFPFLETAGGSLIQTHGGHQGERVYSPEGLSCTLAANPGGFGGKTGLYEVGVPIKCATKTGYQLAQVGDSIDLSYATVNSRRGRVGKEIAHTINLYTSSLDQIQSAIFSFCTQLNTFYEQALYLELLFDLFDMQTEDENCGTPLTEPIRTIEFRHVYFSYPATNVYALKNVSFVLDDRHTYALIGLNGSGKTTLLKLLMKLYKPTLGTILINGQDIEEIDTAGLRKRIEVGRKYQVIVKFNMKYRQFLECTAETYNTEIGA